MLSDISRLLPASLCTAARQHAPCACHGCLIWCGE